MLATTSRGIAPRLRPLCKWLPTLWTRLSQVKTTSSRYAIAHRLPRFQVARSQRSLRSARVDGRLGTPLRERGGRERLGVQAAGLFGGVSRRIHRATSAVCACWGRVVHRKIHDYDPGSELNYTKKSSLAGASLRIAGLGVSKGLDFQKPRVSIIAQSASGALRCKGPSCQKLVQRPETALRAFFISSAQSANNGAPNAGEMNRLRARFQ